MGAEVASAGSWRAGTLRRGEILLGILIFAARHIQIRRKCGDVSPTAELIVAREKRVNVDTFLGKDLWTVSVQGTTTPKSSSGHHGLEDARTCTKRSPGWQSK